jgi:hypothetical protein
LSDGAASKILQAVFDCIGYLQAVHVDSVTLRIRVRENRTHPAAVVKIIEMFLRESIHNGGRIHCNHLKV